MNNAQENTNSSRDGATWSNVTSVPLTEEGNRRTGDESVGHLVRDATTHLSTLIRSEVELAKAELSSEVKKGVKSSVYFVLALTVLGFSLFFLFFTVAEGLAALGLWRWVAFAIVFVLMLLVAGVFGLLGYRKAGKIHKPERTIATLKDTASLRRRTDSPAELPR